MRLYETAPCARVPNGLIPKTADHKVKFPSRLVFVGLMGPVTPDAIGGYTYVTSISDEQTNWTKTYLPKFKHDALSWFQAFV